MEKIKKRSKPGDPWPCELKVVKGAPTFVLPFPDGRERMFPATYERDFGAGVEVFQIPMLKVQLHVLNLAREWAARFVAFSRSSCEKPVVKNS